MRRLMLPLAVALGLAAAARADDWPHLRGPAYDGRSTETGLADAWPADGPPLLWSRDLGQGYSGFAVAAGRLYTQRQTLAGQSLLCLDPATGDTLWELRYDWAWQPKGAYPGPYASPTVAGGRVYYASPTGRVGCADAATGAEAWAVNVRERFQVGRTDFGYAATPLVEAGKVILPVGGPGAALVALDAADGRTAWTAGDDPASYCPALPIALGGRRLVVGYLENALLLVDAATGAVVHRRPLSTGYDEHSAWPLYREPDLLLTGPFRAPAACLALAAGADGAVTARPRWTSRGLANDVVSSVLHEDHVYGFDLKQLQASRHRPSRGVFICLAWDTGAVRWTTDAVGQAAPLVADGKLFLLADTGHLVLARADPTAYREQGRAALFPGEVCWTPPALADGRLFVRSPSRLAAVYVGRPGAAPPAAAAPAARPWHVDPAWLFSRERDYPNDAPSAGEAAVWFAAGALVLAVAALLAALGRRRAPPLRTFGAVALSLGLLGPGPLSAAADRLLFTWPAAVYAAFHVAVAVCWRAQQSPTPASRWLARLAVAGLLLVGYGYFELCRAVGLFIGWSFLVGFPAAFPFTVLAVRTANRPAAAAWTLLAFAALFAGGLGLLWWKRVSAV